MACRRQWFAAALVIRSNPRRRQLRLDPRFQAGGIEHRGDLAVEFGAEHAVEQERAEAGLGRRQDGGAAALEPVEQQDIAGGFRHHGPADVDAAFGRRQRAVLA